MKTLNILSTFLILTFIFSSDLHASKKINPEMKKIAKVMSELFPYISSPEKLKNKRNRSRIKRKLQEIEKRFSGIENHLNSKSVVFRVSEKVIKNQLSDASKVLDTDSNSYAYKMIKGIPKLCIGCHIHDGKAIFNKNLSRSDFGSDFQYAEFNHMTRNYKEALKYYDLSIKKNKRFKKFNSKEILKRQLGLYVLNLDQSKKAQNYLNQFLKDKDLDYFTQVDVKDWMEGLVDSENRKKIFKNKFSKGSLERNIQKMIDQISDTESLITDEKDRVLYLSLTRKLNRHLQKIKNPKDIPVILYWLSFVERKLNYNLFYSMGDLYLKECMTSYTKHPYSKKCYKEYENQTRLSFTGSGGTFIPDEVKKELMNYRKRIFSK